jgi:uncharacterized caspase-like protein
VANTAGSPAKDALAPGTPGTPPTSGASKGPVLVLPPPPPGYKSTYSTHKALAPEESKSGEKTLAPTAAPGAAPSGPAKLGRRVALVIGNANYSVSPLKNPVNDAEALANVLLTELKFEKVMLRTDVTFEGFRTALREFSRESMGAGLGLIYFAGHGTEVGGKNFLIPIDASLAKVTDLDVEAIPLEIVVSQLSGVGKLKLVILDACRNNVFSLAGAGGRRPRGRGLSSFDSTDENTLVWYAAKDGTTADDGTGKHSPFTEALLKHIVTPGLDLYYLLGEVRDDVMSSTGRVQQPHYYGSLGRAKIVLRQ